MSILLSARAREGVWQTTLCTTAKIISKTFTTYQFTYRYFQYTAMVCSKCPDLRLLEEDLEQKKLPPS